MTPLKAELKRLRELREKATRGPWFVGYWTGLCKENHSHNPSKCKYEYEKLKVPNYISVDDKKSREEVIITTEEYGAMSEADSRMIAESANRWLSLIEALEVACEALKYVGCDCDTDECTCEHYIALDKIEQLICGDNNGV